MTAVEFGLLIFCIVLLLGQVAQSGHIEDLGERLEAVEDDLEDMASGDTQRDLLPFPDRAA